MTASPAATTNAIALAQIGMVIPFTVTSQPETKRSNCSKATKENTTTAMVVNGFTSGLHFGIERLLRTTQARSLERHTRIEVAYNRLKRHHNV